MDAARTRLRSSCTISTGWPAPASLQTEYRKALEMKTNYEIHDERGDKTTITLAKWDADVLQITLPDVHAWVQNKYDRVAEKYPERTRRAKGDIVRLLASKEAEKHPEHQARILALLQ
jgi:hypothetical protein